MVDSITDGGGSEEEMESSAVKKPLNAVQPAVAPEETCSVTYKTHQIY